MGSCIIDIANRVAIRYDVTFESPLLAQQLVEQERVGAARNAVERIVGAHDAGNLAFPHDSLELRQVHLIQVAFRWFGIETVPVAFRAAMYRKVLGTRHRQDIGGIIPLHALDEFGAHCAGEKGIFAVRFLAAAPARIAEYVDVRCPEGQAGPPFGIAVVLAGVVVVFGASFNANDSSFLTHQFRIPRGSHTDRLRKYSCCAVVGDAV